MGYTQKRIVKGGRARYTAVYQDIRDVRRSAGTFASETQANKAWQTAEAKVSEGHACDPKRGRQTFERYVVEEWFPNHRLEIRARENYTYYLEAHIISWFRPIRMIEILSAHVRECVTKLEQDGVPKSSIGYCLTILSAIFTTALNDQVVFLHPCKGVTAP